MKDAFEMPGYRRRIVIEPAPGAVLSMLEDDIHAMAVILRHDGHVVQQIEPFGLRMPWTTCPGAEAKLAETFSGASLEEVTARRDKKQNCTHLHDLAVLAAGHAHDRVPIRYDIAATDPVDGKRTLQISRDGMAVHCWEEVDGVLSAPAQIAGETLLSLRSWIGSLDAFAQEAARLLQWGSLVAHGRTLPYAAQSDATKMPANCYTFQPEHAAKADRVGDQYDFSRGTRVPLEAFADSMRAKLASI